MEQCNVDLLLPDTASQNEAKINTFRMYKKLYLSQIARLIIRRRWSKACKLLKTRRGKEQAQEFPHQGFGYTLLSLALIEGPPVKLIKRLLAADPLASQRPDESFDGRLPLHMACCFGASNDVIKLLLNHDEQRRSARIVDSQQNTPLHLIGYYMCNPIPGRSGVSVVGGGECSTTMGTCGIFSMIDLQDLQRSIEDLAWAAPHLIQARNDRNKTFIDILEDFGEERTLLVSDMDQRIVPKFVAEVKSTLSQIRSRSRKKMGLDYVAFREVDLFKEESPIVAHDFPPAAPSTYNYSFSSEAAWNSCSMVAGHVKDKDGKRKCHHVRRWLFAISGRTRIKRQSSLFDIELSRRPSSSRVHYPAANCTTHAKKRRSLPQKIRETYHRFAMGKESTEASFPNSIGNEDDDYLLHRSSARRRRRNSTSNKYNILKTSRFWQKR